MAEANDKYGRIYQNLVDAGCNQNNPAFHETGTRKQCRSAVITVVCV